MTALSATRGEPSPGLRPTPPTSLRCAGGEDCLSLLSQRSWGRSIERQQDREGAGDQRDAGVIGTALSTTRGELSPGLRPTPPTSLRCAGGEVCLSLLSQRSWGRSIERQQDREGAGEQRVAGVIVSALSATRGEPSPGLRPTPPTSLRCAGGEVCLSLLSQRSWGRSSERQRDREGAGEQRVAGVIGTALSATRGVPSPGLSADPSHFASLRGRGGLWCRGLSAEQLNFFQQ